MTELESPRVVYLDVLSAYARTTVDNLDIELCRDVEFYVKTLVDRTVFALAAYFVGQKVECPAALLEVSYPRDWWQAFKARFFPRWALRRWPVVYKTVRREQPFDVKVVYPQVRAPHLEHRVVAVLGPPLQREFETVSSENLEE